MGLPKARNLSAYREFGRPFEDRVRHLLGQPAGERVLLGGVVRAEQDGVRSAARIRPCGRTWGGAAEADRACRRRPTRTRPGTRSRERRASARAPEPRTGGSCRARLGEAGWRAVRTDRRRHERAPQLEPVIRVKEVGWFAKPVRWSDANSQSPERSPVKTRPVRLPPWAAGAARERTRAPRGRRSRARAGPSTPRPHRPRASPCNPLAPLDKARTFGAAGYLDLELSAGSD